jgi:nucleotide-binding universal stress UspA family protein
MPNARRFFQNMLLAVDGSAASNAALAVACSIGREYGAKITACHVVAVHPHLVGRHVQSLPDLADEKRREALVITRNAADIAESTFGITLHVQLIDGDPIEEILRAADAIDADTIVIGNRGQSALSTFILGSVAQGVTERSQLPVLVVHANSTSEQHLAQ